MDIKQQIDIINGMAQRALAGDYSSTAADGLDAEFLPLLDSISRLIEAQRRYGFEMQTVSSQVLSVTEDLSIALEDNTAYAAELYAQAEHIRGAGARSHQTTVTALEEVRGFIARIEGIQDAADKAHAVGTQTRDAIQDGLSLAGALADEIRGIEASSAESALSVQSFIASTGRITGILRTVEDITRQMELLAFNALVESRRAGLEGRSFGVIASAFRELADSSKREVKSIAEVMGGIDAESARLTEMISRNAESVKQCAAHSGRIMGGLGAIDTNFAAVTDALTGVQRHADDQGRIAERISAGMQDIERNSEQVVAGMDGIHAAVQKQKTGMDDLSGVGRHLMNASQSLSQFVRETQNAESSADKERVTQAAQAVFAQMDSAVLGDRAFLAMDSAVHKRLLDKLMSGGAVESVWSNHASGRFVYSNPPAGISNARIRPWFRESIAGRPYVSDVYVSAITHRPCVTVAMPVMQHGQCIGVLGADLKLG